MHTLLLPTATGRGKKGVKKIFHNKIVNNQRERGREREGESDRERERRQATHDNCNLFAAAAVDQLFVLLYSIFNVEKGKDRERKGRRRKRKKYVKRGEVGAS